MAYANVTVDPMLFATGRHVMRRPLVARAGGASLAVLVASVGGVRCRRDAAIGYVERTDDGLQILVSVPPDAEVDLDDVAVTIDGTDGDRPPRRRPTRPTTVRRTAVLAMDTSNSHGAASASRRPRPPP